MNFHLGFLCLQVPTVFFRLALRRSERRSTTMSKKRDIPKYEQTHPLHLATAGALEAEGLKPGPDQLPAALFLHKAPGRESLSALYERAQCVSRDKGKR